MYAKPVVMSQPEETRVKQRQRLLSDELTKRPQPDTRPSTPPGKLEISKISNMLQRSYTGGTATTSRDDPSSRPPSRRQSPEMQSAKAQSANAQLPVQASLRPTSGRNRWKEASPKPAPVHQPNGSACIVAEVRSALVFQTAPVQAMPHAVDRGMIAICCDHTYLAHTEHGCCGRQFAAYAKSVGHVAGHRAI